MRRAQGEGDYGRRGVGAGKRWGGGEGDGEREGRENLGDGYVEMDWVLEGYRIGVGECGGLGVVDGVAG